MYVSNTHKNRCISMLHKILLWNKLLLVMSLSKTKKFGWFWDITVLKAMSITVVLG